VGFHRRLHLERHQRALHGKEHNDHKSRTQEKRQLAVRKAAQATPPQSVNQTSLHACSNLIHQAPPLLTRHNTPPRPYGGPHEANQQCHDSTFGDASGAPSSSPKLLSNPEVITGASYQDCHKIPLDFVDLYQGSQEADEKRARQAKNTAKYRENKRRKASNGLAQQVCSNCKDRKKKCSKELPSCSDCTQ
jgi:hypothetical protein